MESFKVLPEAPPRYLNILRPSLEECRWLLGEPNLPILLLANGYKKVACNILEYTIELVSRNSTNVIIEGRRGELYSSFPPLFRPRPYYIGLTPRSLGVEQLIMLNDKLDLIADIPLIMDNKSIKVCRPRLGCIEERKTEIKLLTRGESIRTRILYPHVIIATALSSWRLRARRRLSYKGAWLCIMRGRGRGVLIVCLEDNCSYSVKPEGEVLLKSGEAIVIEEYCSPIIAYQYYLLSNIYRRLLEEYRHAKLEYKRPLLYVIGGGIPIAPRATFSNSGVELQFYIWNPGPSTRTVEIYMPCHRIKHASHYSYFTMAYEELGHEYNKVVLALAGYGLAHIKLEATEIPLLRGKC